MRTINPNLVNKLKSEEYIPVVLVKLTAGSGEARFTTWAERLQFDGATYFPRGMNISSISYGASSIVSGCTLQLDDVDRFVYASIGSLGPDEHPIDITLATLDQTTLAIPSGHHANIFSGWVSEWSYEPGKTSMKLSSIFSKWTRVTTRMFSTSCSVKVFKSPQCGYTGPGTECDRTYVTCDGYANTLNYRGFRWLEDMEDRRFSTEE